jgi:hypothetical protein
MDSVLTYLTPTLAIVTDWNVHDIRPSLHHTPHENAPVTADTQISIAFMSSAPPGSTHTPWPSTPTQPQTGAPTNSAKHGDNSVFALIYNTVLAYIDAHVQHPTHLQSNTTIPMQQLFELTFAHTPTGGSSESRYDTKHQERKEQQQQQQQQQHSETDYTAFVQGVTALCWAMVILLPLACCIRRWRSATVRTQWYDIADIAEYSDSTLQDYTSNEASDDDTHRRNTTAQQRTQNKNDQSKNGRQHTHAKTTQEDQKKNTAEPVQESCFSIGTPPPTPS